MMNEVIHRRNQRGGITLVEVIGTLAVLLVLAVSAAGILGAITEIGVQTRDATQGRQTIRRFATMLRSDVNRSSDISVSDDQWPIEMKVESVSIRYYWDGESNTFKRSVGTEENPGGLERFQMPRGCAPRVSSSDELLTIVLRDNPPAKPWIIEARRP